MKHFCMIANTRTNATEEDVAEIRRLIEKRGGTLVVLPGRDPATLGAAREGFTDLAFLPEDAEACLVLGGDGTVLQAARELDGALPILGINLGTLGFLAEVERENLEEAIDALFDGDYLEEKRLMLHGKVFREGTCIYEGNALNDIVVTRSGFSRIILTEVLIDGSRLGGYSGDGMILSTPTGSTGYNLAAGGPVMLPDSKVFAVTPICPHSLNAKGIVIPSGSRVELRVEQSKTTQKDEAIVTFDGNQGIPVTVGDRIEAEKAETVTTFLKLPGSRFLDTLRNKMM